MRDPGGAIVALAKPPAASAGAPAHGFGSEVGWHVLNTVDVERAKNNYAELAGWDFGAPIDLGRLGVASSLRLGARRRDRRRVLRCRRSTWRAPHWLFQVRVRISIARPQR